MKKGVALLLVMLLMGSLSHGLFAQAAEQQPQAAAAEPVAEPPVEEAVIEEPALDDEYVDEFDEDVKTLKAAAEKLKDIDPELSAKLAQMAEDFSW